MIAKRLKILRTQAGLSKSDLVKQLPFNYSTYANYESGIREPNCDVLRAIANYYRVSIDYIVGLTEKSVRAEDVSDVTDSEYAHLTRYRKLDEHGKRLVGSVVKIELERKSRVVSEKLRPAKQAVTLQVFNQRASAGLGNYLGDYSEADFEMRRFQADKINAKADFAVRIQGDSMEPKISDADIVYVKSTPQVDPNSIGIFIYDGEAYCKRLKIDKRKGAIVLESLNPSYPPMIIKQPDQLRTVGEVIGVAKE